MTTKIKLDVIPQTATSEQDLTPVTYLSGKGAARKVGFGVRIKGNWTTLNVAQLRTLESVLGVDECAPLAECMVAAYKMSQRDGELERLIEENLQRAVEIARAFADARAPHNPATWQRVAGFFYARTARVA